VKIKPTNAIKTLCLAFRSLQPPPPNPGLWFAKVDNEKATIWVQFKDFDPNEQQVEINVRRTVFYPDKPGRNYITVRGFTLRHAATPWACGWTGWPKARACRPTCSTLQQPY
jgi:hypothetical protein